MSLTAPPVILFLIQQPRIGGAIHDNLSPNHVSTAVKKHTPFFKSSPFTDKLVTNQILLDRSLTPRIDGAIHDFLSLSPYAR
jgi:hypothetical protein